jgi:hypothetical protein
VVSVVVSVSVVVLFGAVIGEFEVAGVGGGGGVKATVLVGDG